MQPTQAHSEMNSLKIKLDDYELIVLLNDPINQISVFLAVHHVQKKLILKRMGILEKRFPLYNDNCFFDQYL